MPNLGKPYAIKLISGSRRLAKGAATVALPLIEDVPPAPAWLPNDHARKEWARLAPILHANKLLTEPGVSVLAHACALHGVIVRAMAAGQQPMAATIGVYRLLLNDFGLTPAASGRVRGVGGNAAGAPNRFDRRGGRPA